MSSEYVPSNVDRDQLAPRWSKVVNSTRLHTVSLANANHKVEDETAQAQLCNAVAQFIKALE